jgi:hypothetical protein
MFRHTLRTVLLVGMCLLFFQSAAHTAQEKPKRPSGESAALFGRWIIHETKEPGKPYAPEYKGRRFVAEGPDAFTLIMEYRSDGTFRRISRIGEKEVVHEGKWVLSGHELRLSREGADHDEVMYVRFDAPDTFTTVEVHEATRDPGLFARFKKAP